MKSLLSILYSLPGYNMKLSDADKEKLVELDSEYGRLMKTYRTVWECNFPTNVEEQYKMFIKAYERGEEYYPVLRIKKDLAELRKCSKGFMELASKFQNFRCFLSKYYIKRCLEFSRRAEFAVEPKKHMAWYTAISNQTPTMEETEAAKKVLAENPYKEPDESTRTINAEKALKYCQEKMRKYDGFKVQMKPNQIPRMSVRSEELALNISPNAMFSEVDLMGLNAHEIRGHVARRYYGAKLGLWLMVYGLEHANDFDEGIAVYNSLHRVKTRKPNILFNIALKTYIASMLPKKTFYEIFDICHKEFPAVPTKVLFSTLIRFKREVEDCAVPGGNGDDQSYFCGYLQVKDMTQKQRDELTRYNIGPEQYFELDDIKQFFATNKFKALV